MCVLELLSEIISVFRGFGSRLVTRKKDDDALILRKTRKQSYSSVLCFPPRQQRRAQISAGEGTGSSDAPVLILPRSWSFLPRPIRKHIKHGYVIETRSKTAFTFAVCPPRQAMLTICARDPSEPIRAGRRN